MKVLSHLQGWSCHIGSAVYDDIAGKVIVTFRRSPEGEENSFPALLKQELGGTIFCVHRLDRETAGVMVLARSQKAAAAIPTSVWFSGRHTA